MTKDSYGAPPDSVVAARIGAADKGPRSSRQDLLETIEAYIRTTAASQQPYNGIASRVPCPSEAAWLNLASGRNPVLPTLTRMNLYANEHMRNLAAKMGGMRQAYFAVAQYLLSRS